MDNVGGEASNFYLPRQQCRCSDNEIRSCIMLDHSVWLLFFLLRHAIRCRSKCVCTFSSNVIDQTMSHKGFHLLALKMLRTSFSLDHTVGDYKRSNFHNISIIEH